MRAIDSDGRSNEAAADDCATCPLISRRNFLQTAAFVSAALAGVAGEAFALPPIRGLRLSTSEKSYPVPAADGVSIDKDEDVIIARTAGKVFAFSLACPHQNTAIKWEADSHRFQCPKHHSMYTPEGAFIEGRATRGLDRFPVRKDGNAIVVNLDSMLQEDEDADKWKKAFITI